MSSQNETIGAKGQFSDFKYQILEKTHGVFGILNPFTWHLEMLKDSWNCSFMLKKNPTYDSNQRPDFKSKWI